MSDVKTVFISAAWPVRSARARARAAGLGVQVGFRHPLTSAVSTPSPTTTEGHTVAPAGQCDSSLTSVHWMLNASTFSCSHSRGGAESTVSVVSHCASWPTAAAEYARCSASSSDRVVPAPLNTHVNHAPPVVAARAAAPPIAKGSRAPPTTVRGSTPILTKSPSISLHDSVCSQSSNSGAAAPSPAHRYLWRRRQVAQAQCTTDVATSAAGNARDLVRKRVRAKHRPHFLSELATLSTQSRLRVSCSGRTASLRVMFGTFNHGTRCPFLATLSSVAKRSPVAETYA